MHAARKPVQFALLFLLFLSLVAFAAALGAARAGAGTEPTVVRELLAKRTQYSSTYQLSDGTYRSEYFETPIHWKDAAGAWHDINTSLIPAGALGSYVTASAPVAVTVAPAKAGSPAVSVTKGEACVSLELLGAKAASPVVVGDRALYGDAKSGADVSYRATGNGLRESILLSSATAPSSYTYRLSHPGLSLRRGEDGQWGLYEKGSKEPSLYLGETTVYDSSKDEADEPSYCEDAQMTVSPGQGESLITYAVPAAWLADPARVYPVTIDPDLLDTNAPTDIYIASGYPTTHLGNTDEENLLGGQVSAQTGTCKTLVRFPQVTSTIPDNAHVISGHFQLRCYWQPDNPHNRVHIYRLTNSSPLVQNASTWDSLSLGASDVDEFSVNQYDATAQAWTDFGCGGVVQKWVSGDWANHGFMVAQYSSEGSSYAKKFRAAEYSGSTYRPKLTVYYEQPEATVSYDQEAYRVGDTVTVNVDLDNVSDTDQVTSVRMGLNRTDSDLTRRRGLLAYYSSAPSGNWVAIPDAPAGFYYYDNPELYGSDHITPSADCSFVDNRVTFKFKLNDETADSGSTDFYSDFGDCQDNDLDTIVEMSSGGEDWSSTWVNNDTNLDVQPTAPEHASEDLGSFVGHEAAATLDEEALELTTDEPDLAIASWGPTAEISRSYSSTRTTSSLSAPGWRFNFERCLTSPEGGAPSASDEFIDYYDESGERYVFLKRDGAYLAPPGFSAKLAQDGSDWTLTVDDGLLTTFDSSGKLTAESDRNDQSVSYTYASGLLTQITAANGQAITLSYDSGKLSSASYETNDGTRTVSYATASPWQVTYYPGQSVERQVRYSYSDSRLTQLTAEDWPQSGQSAYEQFAYDVDDHLTDIYTPSYFSDSRLDAHQSLSYDDSESAAANETSATIEHYDSSGVVSSFRLLTWRDASSRLIVDQNYEGSPSDPTLQLTASADWDATYNLAKTSTDPGAEGGEVATTTYTYEEDPDLAVYGKVLSETDAAENTTTYHYDYPASDPTGQLESETTPNGTTTWNGYDENGNLTSVTKTFSGSGDTTRSEYTYDGYGRMTSEKDMISGTVTQNQDDSFSVSNAVWAETDYSDFAANGEPQTTVAKDVKLFVDGDPQDLTMTTSYDEFGNLTSQSDWGSTTTETHTYDLTGRELTATDAAGVTTHSLYDAFGNVGESYETVSGSDMKANWTLTTYDEAGNELTVTTKLSDQDGNPTTQSVVSNTYDGEGQQLTSSDSTVGGEPEKWVYDVDGNVIEHWDMGVKNYSDAYRSTRTSYDEEDRQTGESEPGDSVGPGPVGDDDPTVVGGTRTVYDELDQVSREISPDRSQVTYTYDGDGNTTAEESSISGTTTSSYGIDDRLESQTDEDDFATSSSYDMLGRITGATGSGQSSTDTTYNTLGWVLETTDADGVSDAKTYDEHGNVVSETIGSQGATTSEYDAANRLVSQTDPNGDVLTTTYDAFGNVAEEKHENASQTTLKDTTTTHDSLGRPLTVGESVSGRTQTYTYPVNTPGGTQEALAYDSAPLTSTEIARNNRGMETSRATTIAANTTLTRSTADDGNDRDQADRWTHATLQLSGHDTLDLNRSFDDAGRVASQSGAGLSSAGSYSYSSTSGLKTNETLPLALGGTIDDSYSYSSDGRLHTWGSDTYTYSASGNLTGDGTASFSYNSANQLTQSTSGGQTTVYGWDTTNAWRTSQGPSGNPTQIQYTYTKSGDTTSNGRLMRYQNSATGVDASYSYDASGQRTKSDVTVGSTETVTSFAYDDLTLLSLAGTQGETTWRIDYLYDEDGMPYAGIYRSPDDSSSPVAFTMITNDHGDVLELLDANGDAFASYRYDPWGLPLASGTTTQSTSLISSALAADIASRQVLRYASYAYDAESGLYYCSARYYDPATRQWTTADSAKADGEESVYQYCRGEPAGAIDPTGDRTKLGYIKLKVVSDPRNEGLDHKPRACLKVTVNYVSINQIDWTVTRVRWTVKNFSGDQSSTSNRWARIQQYDISRHKWVTVRQKKLPKVGLRPHDTSFDWRVEKPLAPTLKHYNNHGYWAPATRVLVRQNQIIDFDPEFKAYYKGAVKLPASCAAAGAS